MLKNVSLIASRQCIAPRIATFEVRGPATICCGLPYKAPGTASLTTAPAREEHPRHSRSQKTHSNRFPSSGKDGDSEVRTASTVRHGSTPTTRPHLHPTRRPTPSKSSGKHRDPNYKSNPQPRIDMEETLALRRYLASGPRSILARDRYDEMMEELAGAIARSESEDDDGKLETRMSGWKLARVKVKRQQDRAKGHHESVHPASGERRTEQNTDSRLQSPAQGFESQKSGDSESRTSSPISKREFAKYLLRIYRPLESARLARVRRNDLRNLSFIDAEAKIGLISELYTDIPPAARGGRGAQTKRWREKMAVDRFERETGENAFWLKRGDESNRVKREEGKTENAELQVTKHSFNDVWKDLASIIQRKHDLHSTDAPAKSDKPADLSQFSRGKKA